MLLKIFTLQDTIKIIDKIEDIEIHQKLFYCAKWSDLYDIKHIPIREVCFPMQTKPIQNYDWEPTDFPKPACDEIIITSKDTCPQQQAVVKLVDYLRNNEWSRVAIIKHAYLCNDDGKTIAKID